MLLPLYSENLGIHSGFQRATESSLCLQVSYMSSVRALVHIGFLSSMHLFAAAHPKTVHASSMYPECTRESWVVSQRIRDQCSICLVPMLCHEAWRKQGGAELMELYIHASVSLYNFRKRVKNKKRSVSGGLSEEKKWICNVGLRRAGPIEAETGTACLAAAFSESASD